MTESAAGKPDEPQSKDRRSVLLTLGVALNAIAGALVAAPIVGYLLSAGKRERMIQSLDWVSLGALDTFPEGQTRLATFRNPITRPWDGATGTIPCWVRRTAAEQFQVFAVNCAHLGCPVRWFPQSDLFMCPCHGGAYYADGARASGPPHARALRVQVQDRRRPALDHRRHDADARARVLDEPLGGRKPCA